MVLLVFYIDALLFFFLLNVASLRFVANVTHYFFFRSCSLYSFFFFVLAQAEHARREAKKQSQQSRLGWMCFRELTSSTVALSANC